jgi:hypothetical protein
VLGERGEQWVGTIVVLIGFIFANKLPFSWILKLVGAAMLGSGAYLVGLSFIALKV